MFLISDLAVSTGAAAVSLCAKAGKLLTANSMHAAATDDPYKRIGLLYHPVDARTVYARIAGARIMNDERVRCKELRRYRAFGA
jgi:hypothetical protein